MSTEVVMVPTGTANTASVRAAFRRLGTDLRLAKTSDDIQQATQLVLPGVGTFSAAMKHIDEHGLRRALTDRIETGRPTLAICIGMQLLCEKSEENTETNGLGVVSETVSSFPDGLIVPQLGWNQVTPDPRCRFLRSGWAYFANSYRLATVSTDWIGAQTRYGSSFVSAMEKGDVLACQFHPELSGEWGSDLLRRWLEGTGSRS